MTSDAELAKLLGAVVASGARAIVVGDYRQLDAVGPGGASKPWPAVTAVVSLPLPRTYASRTPPSATPSTSCGPVRCRRRRPGTQ